MPSIERIDESDDGQSSHPPSSSTIQTLALPSSSTSETISCHDFNSNEETIFHELANRLSHEEEHDDDDEHKSQHPAVMTQMKMIRVSSRQDLTDVDNPVTVTDHNITTAEKTILRDEKVVNHDHDDSQPTSGTTHVSSLQTVTDVMSEDGERPVSREVTTYYLMKRTLSLQNVCGTLEQDAEDDFQREMKQLLESQEAALERAPVSGDAGVIAPQDVPRKDHVSFIVDKEEEEKEEEKMPTTDRMGRPKSKEMLTSLSGLIEQMEKNQEDHYHSTTIDIGDGVRIKRLDFDDDDDEEEEDQAQIECGNYRPKQLNKFQQIPTKEEEKEEEKNLLPSTTVTTPQPKSCFQSHRILWLIATFVFLAGTGGFGVAALLFDFDLLPSKFTDESMATTSASPMNHAVETFLQVYTGIGIELLDAGRITTLERFLEDSTKSYADEDEDDSETAVSVQCRVNHQSLLLSRTRQRKHVPQNGRRLKPVGQLQVEYTMAYSSTDIDVTEYPRMFLKYMNSGEGISDLYDALKEMDVEVEYVGTVMLKNTEVPTIAPTEALTVVPTEALTMVPTEASTIALTDADIPSP